MRPACQRSALDNQSMEQSPTIYHSEKWKKAESMLFSFAPQEPLGDPSREEREFLSTTIKSHYFSNKLNCSDSETNVRNLISLYTDSQFAFPAIQLAHYFRGHAYLYLFAHDGSWKIPNKYFSQFHISGVAHGDDLPYLFAGKSNQSYVKTTENAKNLMVKNYMSKLWTEFAKNGAPTSEWKSVSEGYYLHIDENPVSQSLETFEAKYYDFWSMLVRQNKQLSPMHSTLTFKTS